MNLENLITGATALFSTVGAVAAFRYVALYFSGKPRNNAMARKTDWDGWRGYAEKLEKRLDELELKYDALIVVKDNEIEKLRGRVSELTLKVAELERASHVNDVAKVQVIDAITNTL